MGMWGKGKCGGEERSKGSKYAEKEQIKVRVETRGRCGCVGIRQEGRCEKVEGRQVALLGERMGDDVGRGKVGLSGRGALRWKGGESGKRSAWEEERGCGKEEGGGVGWRTREV